MQDENELTAEVVQEVLDQGRARGSLTLDEVGALVQDADLSPDDLEFLYSMLVDLGVEVVDERAEELGDFSEEEEFLGYLDVTIDHSVDDPVRMYLREIGKVPLLTTAAGDRAGPADREEGRRGQAPADRGQSAPGGLDRQALHGPGTPVPRSHPGGEPGPDQGGGEVRLPAGIQVLHLRHLVDPAGGHSGHRRPGRTIRVPVHAVETMNKLNRVQRELLQKSGREPTVAEIAAALGVTAGKVREIQKATQEPVSLETPVGDEDDSELGDFIEDLDADQPLEVVFREIRREELFRVLDSLPARDRKVLELRFGLKGERPRTLEEVGERFGVTRERIRQVEAKTLNRLKNYRDAQALRDIDG